jgi:hypothetical protein
VYTYAQVYTSESPVPTVKPRVIVTLEPEAFAVLEGMARIGKTTPGKVLTEIAAPVLPALKRLVDASERFASWKRDVEGQLEGVHSGVVSGIDAVIEGLEMAMAEAMEESGGLVGPPGAGGQPDTAQPVGAASRASTLRSARGVVPEGGKARKTPHTNRGVKRQSPTKPRSRSEGGEA